MLLLPGSRYECAREFKKYMKYNPSAIFKLPSEYNNTTVDRNRNNMNYGFCCGASSLTISITTLVIMMIITQLLQK